MLRAYWAVCLIIKLILCCQIFGAPINGLNIPLGARAMGSGSSTPPSSKPKAKPHLTYSDPSRVAKEHLASTSRLDMSNLAQAKYSSHALAKRPKQTTQHHAAQEHSAGHPLPRKRPAQQELKSVARESKQTSLSQQSSRFPPFGGRKPVHRPEAKLLPKQPPGRSTQRYPDGMSRGFHIHKKYKGPAKQMISGEKSHPRRPAVKLPSQRYTDGMSRGFHIKKKSRGHEKQA